MTDILQAAVVPLTLGSTVALVIAIINEWATRPGRDPHYKLALEFGIAIAYFMLTLSIFYDSSLLVRAVAVGFYDDNTTSIARFALGTGGQMIFDVICILLSFRLLKLSEDSKRITEEQLQRWERDRNIHLERERRRVALADQEEDGQ